MSSFCRSAVNSLGREDGRHLGPGVASPGWLRRLAFGELLQTRYHDGDDCRCVEQSGRAPVRDRGAPRAWYVKVCLR